MKKFLLLTMAMVMTLGVTIVSALSLQYVEQNEDRFMLMSKTAEKAIYMDRKSVELESLRAPICEIEADKVVVDYKNKTVEKIEETYFYNLNNNNEIKFMVDEREVFDFYGLKKGEFNVYNGMKKAVKGDEYYEFGNTAFAIVYGHKFSK